MKKRSLLIIAVFLTFAGCSKSILVQTDQPNETDLNRYRTFRFAADDPTNFTFNEANRDRIRLFISRELTDRNFIESDLADFEVRVQGAIEMIRESGVNYRNGLYPYYYPGYHYSGDYHGKDFNESALIINIFDAADEKLIWQGVATGNFKNKKKHIETVLSEVVHSIFERFPYQFTNPAN